MNPVSPGVETTPQFTILPNGRLRDETIDQTDRSTAMWMHLSLPIALIPINFFALAIPPIIWATQKGRSGFVDDHGREMVNMILTGLIAWIIPPIGIIWWIVAIIGMIRGALASGRGEYFRYPMTIRFLSTPDDGVMARGRARQSDQMV